MGLQLPQSVIPVAPSDEVGASSSSGDTKQTIAAPKRDVVACVTAGTGVLPLVDFIA